jgi:DNA-binding CsgD family transcriptional regulator
MDTSFDREASMSSSFATAGDTVDDDCVVSMPAASPPVAHHTRASARVDGGAAGGGLLLRVLDQLDYGLMIVTSNASVRFANRVALRQCSAAHAMRLHDGCVRVRHEGEHLAFTKALAASLQGRRSMLTLHSQDAPVSLAVVPVADPIEPGGAQVALLVFGRRQVCEPLSVEFFAREHRLTAAEIVVLRKLCDGAAPAQIACECGVALSTVRTQVGSIRLKTGARSIGDLVRRVTVLPPMVSVLS